MRGDEVGSRFVFDELTRLPTFDADLTYLMGDGWRDLITPLPATEAYVGRLDEVASTSAGAFVAHHYTRYMGDLSGGQFIAKLVRQAYELEGTQGTDFYVFDIADLPAFKDEYRRRLDEAPWGPDERRAVVDEVTRAYELNRDLLADLSAALR